jgi:hypothetical protein
VKREIIAEEDIDAFANEHLAVKENIGDSAANAKPLVWIGGEELTQMEHGRSKWLLTKSFLLEL